MSRLLAVVALVLAIAAPAAASELPLGPHGLPESRTTSSVAPGVTWTKIERGALSPDERWTVDVEVLRDAAAAGARADAVRAAGFDARVQSFAGPLHGGEPRGPARAACSPPRTAPPPPGHGA
jgi:hypothetical protein